MKRIGSVLAILAVSSLGLLAQMSPQNIVARLEKELRSIASFQADFVQTSTSTTVSAPLRQSGKIYFKKPDLMRWEYGPPEPSTYVYKEGLYLSYFPEDNQLWKQKISREEHETGILGILFGKARLAERYVIESSAFPGGEKGSAQVKLTPREEGDNTYILLEIDRKSWMLRRAVLFDWADNKIEYGFSRIKTNIDLAKDLFEIKVPPDCEIIEDAGPRKK
ncbi:MAG: outer membrane lipoprotein carrier protein LolA [Candidatus Aminicenantes bacterium]|nr:outer membrane lipoprotein carrier protein LolA [Candidatus Aminicenantes bacterium]